MDGEEISLNGLYLKPPIPRLITKGRKSIETRKKKTGKFMRDEKMLTPIAIVESKRRLLVPERRKMKNERNVRIRERTT